MDACARLVAFLSLVASLPQRVDARNEFPIEAHEQSAAADASEPANAKRMPDFRAARAATERDRRAFWECSDGHASGDCLALSKVLEAACRKHGLRIRNWESGRDECYGNDVSTRDECAWRTHPPSLHGLAPSKATLADVERVLGAAPHIFGDGCVHSTSVCYAAGTASAPTFAIFSTNGFAGPGERISEISLGESLPDAVPAARCVKPKRASTAWRFSNGVSLGTTLAALRRLIGNPEDDEASPVEWICQWALPEHCAGRAFMDVVLEDGRATSITLRWDESC